MKGLLGLVAVCAAIAGGLTFAGVFGGHAADGAHTAAVSRGAVRTVEQLPPPLPERGPSQTERGASQTELGPLPEPAGAAHVDLSRRALLSYLRLRPEPKAGLAFDLADGRVLWSHRATRTRPIASLTKLMTALLAVERFGPHDRVRIPRAADWVAGSRMGSLKPGRRVRADVLLKGLLIASGNDAATTLAIAGAGSERAWVQLMNRRAQLLGLSCTHFVDSYGLDRRNRSCPADLAVLAIRAMNEPRISAIARRSYVRVWTGAGKKLTLRTTNHLLRDHYPGAIGLKTGFTNPAGFCLVAIVQRGSKRIGIVVLGSKDSFGSARSLARAAVQVGVLPKAV